MIFGIQAVWQRESGIQQAAMHMNIAQSYFVVPFCYMDEQSGFPYTENTYKLCDSKVVPVVSHSYRSFLSFKVSNIFLVLKYFAEFVSQPAKPYVIIKY